MEGRSVSIAHDNAYTKKLAFRKRKVPMLHQEKEDMQSVKTATLHGRLCFNFAVAAVDADLSTHHTEQGRPGRDRLRRTFCFGFESGNPVLAFERHTCRADANPTLAGRSSA